MSEKKTKKERLRELGVVSPIDEIREQMAAMSSPSYMEQMREQLAALSSPAYGEQMREQLAALSSPAYGEQMREQLAALSSPSYAEQMREQLAAMSYPAYGEQLREQLAALSSPAYGEQMREQLAAMSYPAYGEQLREQLAALSSPSYAEQMREQLAAMSYPAYGEQMREQLAAMSYPAYGEQLREQLAALSSPSYAEQMREQLATLTGSSYMARMREQMAALTNPPHLAQMSAMVNGGRMEAALSVAVSSYQELVAGSTLASFLVSPDREGKSPTQFVDGEYSDGLVVGDFAVLTNESAQSIDLQIVKAISEGEVAKLSPTAIQRLQSVYLQIVVYWVLLLRIVETYMAYVFLTTLMASATVPADIPKQVQQIPNYERHLLAGYRVVNRDGARLRAGPSKSAEVIVSLKLGLPVEVLEANGQGWFRVVAEYEDESVEGWIHLTVTTPVPAPKKSLGQTLSLEQGKSNG